MVGKMDNIKIFSFCDEHIESLSDIPHTLMVNDINDNNNKITAEKINWCIVYCKSKWGWYFIDNIGYIGFSDITEYVYFVLIHSN